jgi:hypothetical protein
MLLYSVGRHSWCDLVMLIRQFDVIVELLSMTAIKDSAAGEKLCIALSSSLE